MRWLTALAFLAAAPAWSQAGAPPTAPARWTIRSDDCVSVNADGEPWQECGFQAFDMTPDGARVLTVSATGIVQLWDGATGREIRRIEWPDQPGGASGWPDGRAAIVGAVAVAVVHQNQVLLLDLADGRTRAQSATDAMQVLTLRPVGAERLFVEIRDREWRPGAGEIDLATGAIRPVPDLTDLARLGPAYWMGGARPPFTFHRAGADPAEIESERSCMPFDADYCVWREIPGTMLHLFDVAGGRWRSFDLGRTYDGYVKIEPLRAGNRFFALICERSTGSAYPPMRPCAVVDLATNRAIHQFSAMDASGVGALDEQGRPELRLLLSLDYAGRAEALRVSADGVVRQIDPGGRVDLLVPGGGMVVPDWGRDAALLIDASGRTIARLPFHPQSCGTGWPRWTDACRFSADGRLWLVPRSVPVGANPEDHRLDLTLYEIPQGAAAAAHDRPPEGSRR